MRFLVVDDFELMRGLIKQALTGLGYQDVTCVESAEDALNALKEGLADEKAYQVIISDINMPGMDGIEFLKVVRHDEQLKNIIFIIVSAEQQSEQVVTALKEGANEFIRKPISTPELKRKIEKVLQKAGLKA